MGVILLNSIRPWLGRVGTLPNIAEQYQAMLGWCLSVNTFEIIEQYHTMSRCCSVLAAVVVQVVVLVVGVVVVVLVVVLVVVVVVVVLVVIIVVVVLVVVCGCSLGV